MQGGDVRSGLPQRQVVAMSLAVSAVMMLGIGTYFLAGRGDTLVGSALVAVGIADAATAAFFARRPD